MNKQQENIENIITLEATEEIVYIFLDHVLHTDKTVGLIANKELIEFAMGEALSVDVVNVRRVDIEKDYLEYMISIDDDGNMVIQPVEYYDDKFFKAMDYVYISMDGDVDQLTIDMCLDRNATVVLFGYEDEPCECACKACSYTPTAIYRVNGKEVDEKTFAEYDKVIKERIEELENEMNLFRHMMFGF